VIVWDTGRFLTTETTGCANFAPFISRDKKGRYTVFLTDCDHTGDNADGSMEVAEFDQQDEVVRQVTLTSAGAGELAAAVSSNKSGKEIYLIANDDPTGGNPDGSFEVFHYKRDGGPIIQVTDSNPLVFHAAVSVDANGRNLAIERIDFVTGESEIVHVNTGSLAETVIVGGVSRLPFSCLEGEPVVVFSSLSDLVGSNPDGNAEIFKARVE
jgi:hypothetical protein